MKRIALGLLILFAFAVPWEYSLDLGEPFGNVARILGVFLLLAAICSVPAAGGMRRPGALQWLTLALYLYFALSCLWTVDAETTTEKIRAYFQVMMTVWLVWELAQSPHDLRGLMRAFVAGCWVLAVLTLWDFSSASAVAEQQIRFVAEGQDPNDVARFLDLGFPLAALLFSTEEGWAMRLLAAGYFPAGVLAVVLTASRGGFSGAVAALLGSAAVVARGRPRVAASLLAALGATAAALWWLVPTETLDRLRTIPEEAGSLNERLSLWTAGWRAFERAPWWGYGAGTFSLAAGLAPGDTAHNTLMAILVTGGLVGMTLFLAILACAGWAVARTAGLLRLALGTALAVWLLTSMVGSVEENRTTWLLFGVMGLAGRLAIESPEALRAAFSPRKAGGDRARHAEANPAHPYAVL